MLDIKVVREETGRVKAQLAKRGRSYDEEVDRAVALDEQRRSLIKESETIKADQNRMSKRIPEMKKNGEDTTAAMAEMKLLSARAKELSGKLSEIEAGLRQVMLGIPCLPDDSVPEGKDSGDNVVVRTWANRGSLTSPSRHIGISAPAWALSTRPRRQSDGRAL